MFTKNTKNAGFLSQNTTLLFNKSATCYRYCFVAIMRLIPKYKKKKIIQLQYWSDILYLTNMLYKVYTVHDMHIRKY